MNPLDQRVCLGDGMSEEEPVCSDASVGLVKNNLQPSHEDAQRVAGGAEGLWGPGGPGGKGVQGGGGGHKAFVMWTIFKCMVKVLYMHYKYYTIHCMKWANCTEVYKTVHAVLQPLNAHCPRISVLQFLY